MSIVPNEQPFDPNQRRLCPDGACVGVIGEDGKCKVCGTLDPDGPPVASMDAAPPMAEEPAPSPNPAPHEEGDFDPNRRLCADDTCIGVLDEHGRCKICGRAG
jgi:hypothetical protein